jgi:hypothetical protein
MPKGVGILAARPGRHLFRGRPDSPELSSESKLRNTVCRPRLSRVQSAKVAVSRPRRPERFALGEVAKNNSVQSK